MAAAPQIGSVGADISVVLRTGVHSAQQGERVVQRSNTAPGDVSGHDGWTQHRTLAVSGKLKLKRVRDKCTWDSWL
ncbi:hypothetical protein M3J09_010975 [Ascochyta lentis]